MKMQTKAIPVIHGEEAKQILKEAKTKPTKRAVENAKKIVEFFSQLMKES